MDRERELKLGARGSLVRAGFVSISETAVGGARTPDWRSEGTWWRKVLTRWELWIWMGSSTRMSLYLKPDFWRLQSVSMTYI